MKMVRVGSLLFFGLFARVLAGAEPNIAFKFKNRSGQKVHMLLIQSNDFRHVLDAGGWTNKVVKSLLDLSTDVLTLLPDIEKAVKKGDKAKRDSDDDEVDDRKTDNRTKYKKALAQLEDDCDAKKQTIAKKYASDKKEKDAQLDDLKEECDKKISALKKKYGIKEVKTGKSSGKSDIFLPGGKKKISKDDVKKAEKWIKATESILASGGAFLGNILPHVALAAVQKKDYFTQVYPGVKVYAYKSGKSPLDKVMHLTDLTVAIFPDDEFGVAKFDRPLFVRSFDPAVYNTVYYGPEDGHATFKKIDFATDEVLKETEKSFLPVKLNKTANKIEVPEEGDDVLNDLAELRASEEE